MLCWPGHGLADKPQCSSGSQQLPPVHHKHHVLLWRAFPSSYLNCQFHYSIHASYQQRWHASYQQRWQAHRGNGDCAKGVLSLFCKNYRGKPLHLASIFYITKPNPHLEGHCLRHWVDILGRHWYQLSPGTVVRKSHHSVSNLAYKGSNNDIISPAECFNLSWLTDSFLNNKYSPIPGLFLVWHS